MAPPVESVPEAVDVDLSAKKITLGSGAASTYGAVWFSGTITAGGFDVCTTGNCRFNTGIRSFFIVDYNGTGDGFTFALINSDNNDANSVGGDAWFLGYAGVGNVGILPPKWPWNSTPLPMRSNGTIRTRPGGTTGTYSSMSTGGTGRPFTPMTWTTTMSTLLPAVPTTPP